MKVRTPIVGAVMLLAWIAPASVAAGRPPCGQDGSRDACVLRQNRADRGSLPNGQRFYHRWYVLRVRPRTRLRVTVDDAEHPTCTTCGSLRLTLLGAQGAQLRQSALVSVRNGIDPSIAISRLMRAGGTYYAQVGGYTNGEPLPFTVRATGRPALRR